MDLFISGMSAGMGLYALGLLFIEWRLEVATNKRLAKLRRDLKELEEKHKGE